MKAAQISIHRWMDNKDVVYNGIKKKHKKEWNLAICNIKDGAREYNAKRNKSVRGRQIPYDFTCVWFKKKNKLRYHA